MAASYEKGRPGYPPAALAFLRRTYRLGPGSTVVELGCGTGKLTRDLRPWGAALVGVEPSAAMREAFASAVPDVLVLEGTAEATGLPDGLADLVVAAQAFHWFRPRASAREMARILAVRGGVAVLWNVRDRRAGLLRAIDRLVDRRTPRRPRSWERWRRAFAPPRSPFEPLRRRLFRRVVPTPVEALVQHTLSVSRVGLLAPPARRAFERELRRLLARHPASRGRRSVPIPITTEVYTSRRRPSARRATRRSAPSKGTSGTSRATDRRPRRMVRRRGA